jgi:hypothetical protein
LALGWLPLNFSLDPIKNLFETFHHWSNFSPLIFSNHHWMQEKSAKMSAVAAFDKIFQGYMQLPLSVLRVEIDGEGCQGNFLN